MNRIVIPRFVRSLSVLTGLILISLTLFTSPALAHGRIEVGPYVIVIGWEQEPVVVGERNPLIIEITEDDAPVEGVEATLDIEVIFGPELYRGNLAPTDEPGIYAVEMLPTVRGQYTVRFVGMIGDVEVDELIEPEEVLPVGALAFPEVPPDTAELEASIESLQADVASARLMGIIGIVVGGLGLLVGVVGFLRKNSGNAV